MQNIPQERRRQQRHQAQQQPQQSVVFPSVAARQQPSRQSWLILVSAQAKKQSEIL